MMRDLLRDEESLGPVFVGVSASEEFTEDGVVPVTSIRKIEPPS